MTDRGRGLALGLGLLVLLAPAALHAQPIKFELAVSPMNGGENDTFTATVQIELAGVSGPERYWPPDFGDFQLIDSKTTQGSVSVNDPTLGQQLRLTLLHRYTLKPTRTGKIRIKPAKIKLDGQDYETADLVVVVGGQGTLPSLGSLYGQAGSTLGVDVPGFEPPDPRIDRDVFLHVAAEPKNPYVGQQVTVTWMLYARSEVLKFEPHPPSQLGWASETLYEPDAYFTYHDDTVGRNPYVVAIISKRAVFPTRSGRLEIKPFTARVSTIDSPLGEPRELASHPLVLDVRPLPGGAPAGFDPSMVGRFTVEADVDRKEIEASESLTLKLTVRGEGGIRLLQAPVLSFPGLSFRAPRDDKPVVDTSGPTVKGERVFRYWTTPGKGGAQNLPAIALAYFDPADGTYKTVSTLPIPILVKGDPSQSRPANPTSSHENLIARDIRLIHEGESITSRTAPLLYRSPWFWAAGGVPPLAFVLVVVIDRLRQRLKRETPRARLRRARGKARAHFRTAEIHLRGNRPAKFFGELSKALYEHLEERLVTPIQSMTRDELREVLRKKGFEQATINQIDLEIEAFDFARFAPSMAGPGEMRAALRKIKDLLRRIEKTRLHEEQEAAA